MAEESTTEAVEEHEALLDLATFTEREHIKLDGKRYELKNAEEMTALELQRLQARGRRLEQLMALPDEKLNEAQQIELERLPDLLCQQVMVADADDEVHQLLSASQKIAVVRAFTAVQVRRLLRTGASKALEALAGLSGPTGVI